MDEYVIAKYIRLSLEDGKSDSVSIESQRGLLNRAISDMETSNKVWMGAEVLEFVDNGFSGTTFERPGVQELLELVRDGKVHCILVKDFSRFGRNSIETGYFIERVFPFYRVRFISVEDAFDTAEHEGDTGGMEVSLKFLINEQYSRDLSRKILSAKRARMWRGEYVSERCIFGYGLDEKRQMVIDAVAAETVRLIYELYGTGTSISDIEKQLYKEGRMTPDAYKKQKNSIIQDEPFHCVWQKPAILHLLGDEQYTGTYTAGKTKSIDPISHRRKRTEPTEWIRIPGHHPAIVPQELFDKVQNRLYSKREPPKRKVNTSRRYAENTASVLKGKVFCGHCGHSMRISSTRNATYHCWFTRSMPDLPCYKLRVLKSKLEQAIFEIIRQQAKVILNAASEEGFTALDVMSKQIDVLRQIEEQQQKKRALYEQMVVGEIGSADYADRKSAVEVKLSRLEQILASRLSHEKKEADDEEKKQAARTVGQAEGLTQELVDMLVEKVLLYSGERMEIHWNIADFGCVGDDDSLRHTFPAI